jgi:lipooligosaccharide transport system permease protein
MSEPMISLHLAWQVVVRNWIVYRKDFLANISPTLADPALMMTALGMGLSPFIGTIGGLTYAQYLAPGMIATTALFGAFFDSSYGFYVRMTFESIFKAMLTTPIGVREIVVGEYLWIFLRISMMGGVVGVVLAVLGLIPNLWMILVFPFLAGFLAVPCSAIGLLAASFVRNMNQFQTVYSFLIAPMYFLSGVFFPLDGRPVLHAVAQLSPFYHGVRLLQMTAWGRWEVAEAMLHVAALVVFTLVLGFWALRRIHRMLTA